MFQKSEHDGEIMDTIIGSSIQVEGNFVGEGNIIVEGEVKGNLKTSQNLEAGEHSKITADVEASNALVAGEVVGNLKIDGKLELTSTAKINGDIQAGILIAASGAAINGHCQIGGSTQSTSGKNKKANEHVEEDEEVEE